MNILEKTALNALQTKLDNHIEKVAKDEKIDVKHVVIAYKKGGDFYIQTPAKGLRALLTNEL